MVSKDAFKKRPEIEVEKGFSSRLKILEEEIFNPELEGQRTFKSGAPILVNSSNCF